LGFLGRDVGWYDRSQAFSLDFWFYVGQEYQFTPNERAASIGKGLPFGVPILQHRDGDGSGGSGYRLQLEDGQLWVYLAHSRPANMIALRVLKPLPVKEWTHITVTYDGSSRAAGTHVYLDGAATERPDPPAMRTTVRAGPHPPDPHHSECKIAPSRTRAS